MANDRTGNHPVRTYRNISLLNVGDVVSATKADIFSGLVYNNNAAVRYLKIYNKVTAPDQNDTPVMTIPLAPQTYTPINCSETGAKFLLGIGVRATTGVADADNTAPGANEVIVNLFFD